jgi:glycogen debranching enzyme
MSGGEANRMPEGAPEDGDDVIRISPFYIPASDSVATHGQRVLKFANCFAVLDDYGNAQASGASAEGLFFEDTRYLSQLLTTIEETRPLLLSSTVTEDNAMLSVDLANPDLSEGGRLWLPRATVLMLTMTTLGEDTLFQVMELRNFGLTPAQFRLSVYFDADFADIFEVRGMQRAKRGSRLPEERRPEGPVLAYRGLDEIVRRTRLVFDPYPKVVTRHRAIWEVHLAAGGKQTLQLAAHCERDDRPRSATTRVNSLAAVQRRLADREARAAHLYSSNESFNDCLNRARADLDMLTTETPHGLYVYAGIPWFSTTFGRDGLLTALECLWLDPMLAAGTLRFLAAHQATAFDADADAEPGKILHEARRGEMAALGEVPFGRYYGSVDSTPLFITLAAAYYERTGDLGLIRLIWPNIEAAVTWMARHGDLDGDGFLEYDRKSATGLANQGWKDSADSVFHADGHFAEAPIALAEVQAYAHAAYLGAGHLAAALGFADKAQSLTKAAAELRHRFEEAFWQEDLGCYALALDADKRPCRVRASNAGHALLGGLASPERALAVADTLMAPGFFSGWGIRTLAEGEARYNPASYHNGSIWPHDNGLIALGFAHYGLKQHLLRLMTGLFDAVQYIELRRLPELFCGFARRPGMAPTAYPVACSPQAWSAAALFAVLGGALGVSFAPHERQIRFRRPTLPLWLDELKISNLRLCESSVDLVLRRSHDDVGLTVVRRDGPVEIVLTS